MKKVFLIARWEYLEKIKNKSFLFSMFVLPLIIIGFSFLPTILEQEEDLSTKAIGIIQENIDLYNDLENSLSKFKTNDNQPAFLLRRMDADDIETAIGKGETLVNEKVLDGILIIRRIDPDSFKIEYRANNITAIRLINRLENASNQCITNWRLKNSNINPQILKLIEANYSLETIKISKKGQTKIKSEQAYVIIFGFVFLLYFSIIMSSSLLVRSIAEEKSNRIIEILVSSSETTELMLGKVIGLSALGITQLMFWGLLIISFAGPFILQNFQNVNIGLSLIYFLLGYIFYASLFVGLGSIANTEQESQSIMSILYLIIILPVIFSFQIMENPDSTLANILTYIPLTTPTVIVIKLNVIGISLIEEILTLLLMFISILITSYLSGKIFRIAILSYGRTPSISEIIKWLKS